MATLTETRHTSSPEPAGTRERPPPWVLALLGAELAAIAVLALAVRRLDGPSAVGAVLLTGAVVALRRAVAVAWSNEPVPGGGGLAAVVRGPAGAGRALAGAAVALGAGVAAYSYDHDTLTMVAPALGLVAGDVVLVTLARLGRRRRRHAADWVGPRTRRDAPAAPALAFAGVVGLLLLVLANAAGSGDARLLAALAVVALPPFVLTGSVPALVVPGLSQGRRDAVVPALLAGGGIAAVSVLAVTAAPEAVLGAFGGRLARHAPYAAAAAGVLGMGQVLVHHLVAAGRRLTAVVHLVIAAGFQVAMVASATGTDPAVAVNAALGGAVVLFTGLAVTTVVSAPFPSVAAPAEDAPAPRRVGVTVLALTAAGAAVRLASEREFWLDEAASARAADGSLPSMLEAVRSTDPHPPLQMAFTWLARQVLGDGVLALRAPSLVAGTLLVPLLYVAGRELYDRRVGIVAATIGAFAPALVWFSTEARPPVFAALLATLSLLAMVRALRRGWTSDWVLLGLAGAALVWSHQLAWVHVAVLVGAAAVAVARRKGPARAVTGLVAATAIIVCAGAGLAAYRSGASPPPALPPLEFATDAAPGEGTSLFPAIGSGVSALVGLHPTDVTSRLLALWPLGILLSLLVLGRARSGRGVLLLVLSAAPFVTLFVAQLAGMPRHPAFALGWAATAIPMVALLAARALTSLAGRWTRVRPLAAALAGVLIVALVDQTARVEPLPRYDVGPLTEAVAARAGASDVIVFEPRALRDLVRYRARDGVTVLSLSAADPDELDRYRRVFVVAAFALATKQESGPNVIDLVKDLSSRRDLVAERGRPDVKMWEFA